MPDSQFDDAQSTPLNEVPNSEDYAYILAPELDPAGIDSDDPGFQQSWAPLLFKDKASAEFGRRGLDSKLWSKPAPILWKIPCGNSFSGPWFKDVYPEDEIGNAFGSTALDRAIDEMVDSPLAPVRCWIDGDWPISNIIERVHERAHFSPAGRRIHEPLRFLALAAHELEQEFRREFQTLNITISVEAVEAFWTSYQVQLELKKLGRKIYEGGECTPVSDARYLVLQHIKRYLAGIFSLPNIEHGTGARWAPSGAAPPVSSAPRRPGARAGKPADGERLRQLRGAYSQVEFAEKCGLSVSTIQRGENGQPLSEDALRRIAETASVLRDLSIATDDLVKDIPQK